MSAQTMKLTRVWETELSWQDPATESASDLAVMNWLELEDEEKTTAADIAAVFAGRACYQSWDKPNPDTKKDRDYLAHVLHVQHHSLFAHASVGYYIEGVSRSLTHELVRHRWFSFSQLSQRYVKIDTDLSYVVPPLLQGNWEAERVLTWLSEEARIAYQELVKIGTEQFPNATSKQVREAARCVLPNMTETKIVVTANLRAWRDMLGQRMPTGADAEIRKLARLIYDDLEAYAPGSMQDIPKEVM